MSVSTLPRRSARHRAGQADVATVKTETKEVSGHIKTSGSRKRTLTPPPSTPGHRQKRAKKKEEDSPDASKVLASITGTSQGNEEPDSPVSKKRSEKTTSQKATELQAKKLKSYSQYASKSPFPTFAHPTPPECKLAHQILARLHGARTRPVEVVAPTGTAGCGDSPSVLDALVRTILSQNTSDKNSGRAKRNMDTAYGGSDKWATIVEGGQPKLQKTIESGGLSKVKSRVIISILEQTKDQYGDYSLDHLFHASDEDAMREMLAFQGVGPKTASCVLLFCLRRDSFAVDTHVYRITGLLGWRPSDCSREEAQAHLDATVPAEDKYGLHILLVKHGKTCEECRAGGKSSGRCDLRKAFRIKKEKADSIDDGDASLKHEDEHVKDELDASD